MHNTKNLDLKVLLFILTVIIPIVVVATIVVEALKSTSNNYYAPMNQERYERFVLECIKNTNVNNPNDKGKEQVAIISACTNAANNAYPKVKYKL